ncbi:hypothetical protein QCM80_41535 [Bradyrhizobium sp. SSUT112]|uniref:hypothetical protein n=1 Tax=Bradyrhizobium sp. SSUT112 TaxID=3040604 RepID=UPI002448C640|nr:hypothetical protein [Bradyrhizobium sp. SSUT112]MDH2357029.1 hypothetical protein [Bradyrhizobium sp. SSUT112]
MAETVLMTVAFGVTVSMTTVDAPVGIVLGLQLPVVNQSVELAPVHVSACADENSGIPARAVPASSSTGILAARTDGERRYLVFVIAMISKIYSGGER